MASGGMDSNIVDITLTRGKAGLGFNIRGGTDIPHIKGDTGVYITKIRDKGAAAEDGRLKEGDKILEINGSSVLAVTHTTAVNFFLNAGNTVNLKIIPGEEKRVRDRLEREEKQRLSAKLGQGHLVSVDDDKRSPLVSGISFLLALGLFSGGAYLGYRYVKYSETPQLRWPSWLPVGVKNS